MLSRYGHDTAIVQFTASHGSIFNDSLQSYITHRIVHNSTMGGQILILLAPISWKLLCIYSCVAYHDTQPFKRKFNFAT